MPGPVAASELLQRIPAFLRRLTELETMTEVGVADALAASGLDPRDDFGDRTWLTFDHLGHDDGASYERRLRLAITRLLGKPTGGARHWDAGCVNVGAVFRDNRVSLVLHPQFSARNLRTAVERWLDGMEVRAWLVESRFAEPDAEPGPDGRWPTPDGSASQASVWTRTDGTTRVTLFMESGVRPPGTKGSTDQERWTDTLAYLADGLGPADRPGWWRRGSRSFRIEGMRSSARSITIAEAAPGTVYGPLDRVSVIPTTPDPDPVAAVALLRALTDLRGVLYEDAVAGLVAAGLVTGEQSRRSTTGAALLSATGQTVGIDLVDGRLARGVVEATAATSWDAVEETFGDAFGPSESHGFDRRWRVGTMVVKCAGTAGDNGFERLRAEVAEDTAEAVSAARAWLLAARPLDDVWTVGDAWHARCLGAALSIGVVPAVVAGQPIWRVDDRILWLQEDRLHAAGPGAWPAWAAGMPPGGTSAPPPADELRRFVDAVSSWRSATPADALATLLELGWTTPDPDALHRSERHAALSLRRPAAASLSMWLSDGRLSSWRMELTDLTGAVATERTERDLDEVLAPYADRDRGATVGEFRLSRSGGFRATVGQTVTLEGLCLRT